MRKPATILLLAILVGGLGAALVYRYLRVQQAELAAAREEALGATVDVVVADQIIPIGSKIEAGQVRLVRWPVDAEPQGAVHETDGVVGRIARMTVQKNQPVSELYVTSEAAGLLPLLIKEGMRAMSVKVDKVTGVSGFITPNSRVDVLVSGKIEGGADQEERSKLFLQNVHVLAIGTSIEQQDDKPVEVPTVTLLVSPDDAEKLTLAASQEPVRLALRNYRDEEEVATAGSTTRKLFSVDVKRTGNGRKPPSQPSVEILLGEKRTRQVY